MLRIFQKEEDYTIGENLSPVACLILNLMGLPLLVFFLYMFQLRLIDYLGEKGAVPFGFMIASFTLAWLLSRLIAPDILFAWLEPFLIYSALLFCKFTFADDSGFDLAAWGIFFMLVLIMLAGAGVSMAGSWGGIYLFPIAGILFSTVSHHPWIFIRYILAYLIFAAIIICVVKTLRMLIHREKALKNDEYSIWQSVTVFVLTIFGLIHPAVLLLLEKSSLTDLVIGMNSASRTGFYKVLAELLSFFCSNPVTSALGAAADYLAAMMSQLLYTL